MPSSDPIDAVLAALDELELVLRETMERCEVAIHSADEIRRLRERGHSYREIVPMEQRPLIVELLTQSLFDLSDASGGFRRAEASALYSEGLTMAEIADLFGITRQRVAALLDKASSDESAIGRQPGQISEPESGSCLATVSVSLSCLSLSVSGSCLAMV